jgi:hypothetical protein
VADAVLRAPSAALLQYLIIRRRHDERLQIGGDGLSSMKRSIQAIIDTHGGTYTAEFGSLQVMVRERSWL